MTEAFLRQSTIKDTQHLYSSFRKRIVVANCFVDFETFMIVIENHTLLVKSTHI
jgi:hypothetical protein